MAQIIKHRRGSIDALSSATAKKGELIMATGSVGNMNGPWIFVGETEGSAGAFRGVSKVYQGTAAPDLTVGTWGSTLNGTPFHASSDKTLYVLSNSGNVAIDLTGNIEGNTITNVEITNLTGSTANISNVSGSFTGSGMGLYNIPASGITGLELNRISDGTATASISQADGLRINTNTEVTGTFNVNGNTSITGTFIASNGAAFIDQGLISQNSNLLLTSGSGLIIQDSGNANIAGNVYITGSEFVDRINGRTQQWNYLALNGGENGAPDVELSSHGDISLWAEGGTVNVTGSMRVTGDIIFSGSINLGDFTGDTVNFTGEVSSSILPQTHNAFDLGSTDKNWRNLHVSGTAYVDTLQARQVNFSDLGILQDLTVSGSTYLGNGGDITVISGSVYNDQLTNNRVVIVGTNGLLEDDANFTFDGTTLKVGNGDFEVDVLSGDTRLSGSLLVNNNLNVVNGVGITGSLGVSGSAQFISTINVDGEATLASATVEDLTDNRIVLAGTGGSLEDDANFTFDGTTFKVGDGDFEVGTDGNTRTSGSVTVVGGVLTDDINGITQNTNSLHLNGGTFGAPEVELTSIGQISLFSEGSNNDFAINMTGSVHITNELDVTGSVTILTDLNVSGGASVTGAFTVGSGSVTTLGGNLYVSGNLEVLGSQTNVNLESNTVNIGDNILLVNAYSPFDRYAGLAAYDSGSSGLSGSMLWDSVSDYWLFVSSSGQSSKVIGTTADSMGSEVSLTNTYFPIATGTNTIGDSLLRYSGTTLSFNTNKFTIDSGTGDTAISGNLTLSYSGGTDAGSVTSVVMFRNSSNVVGYVDTTDTQNVTTQLLGYDETTGNLEFSSVIDGGTY